MGYLNIPANGWPQLKDLEKLDKLAQEVGNLPTFTSNDRIFLEALPAMPTEEGKTVLTATTDNQGNTELTYDTPEVEGSDIAPTFSESVTYSDGTLVYYEGILYKYTEDHAAGAWDPSEVTPTSAAAEFVEIKSELDELKNTLNRMLITDITISLAVSVTSFHVPIPSHNGYIPIAVVGFDKDNDTVPPYKTYLEMYNNDIQVYAAFPSTGGNIRFYILYAKNQIIN